MQKGFNSKQMYFMVELLKIKYNKLKSKTHRMCLPSAQHAHGLVQWLGCDRPPQFNPDLSKVEPRAQTLHSKSCAPKPSVSQVMIGFCVSYIKAESQVSALLEIS